MPCCALRAFGSCRACILTLTEPLWGSDTQERTAQAMIANAPPQATCARVPRRSCSARSSRASTASVPDRDESSASARTQVWKLDRLVGTHRRVAPRCADAHVPHQSPQVHVRSISASSSARSSLDTSLPGPPVGESAAASSVSGERGTLICSRLAKQQRRWRTTCLATCWARPGPSPLHLRPPVAPRTRLWPRSRRGELQGSRRIW